MFRDASEELKRLEAELLAEEPEELPPQEPEEPDPWQYEDTRPRNTSGAYQNYSNDYGKKLRNYASGYRAYNSDDTDEDLEEYSEAVRKPKRSGTGCLIAIIFLLTFAVAAAVIVLVAMERGLI